MSRRAAFGHAALSLLGAALASASKPTPPAVRWRTFYRWEYAVGPDGSGRERWAVVAMEDLRPDDLFRSDDDPPGLANYVTGPVELSPDGNHSVPCNPVPFFPQPPSAR